MIFLVSLIGIATPLYIGELLRCFILKRQFGVNLNKSIPVLILERTLDAIILLFLLVLCTPSSKNISLIIIASAILLILVLVFKSYYRSTTVIKSNINLNIVEIFYSVVLTFFAWISVPFIIYYASVLAGSAITIPDSIWVFTSSTIGGALTLTPMGVGTTGSIAILYLNDLLVPKDKSVEIVIIYRLLTVYFTFSISVASIIVFYLRKRSRKFKPVLHFDEISTEYLNQFKTHIWDYLLTKKTSFIDNAIVKFIGKKNIIKGLDMGCGLGIQCQKLAEKGYEMTGLDNAAELIENSPYKDLNLVIGSALKLPFANDTFDFAYTIGVLHHLTGNDEQEKSIDELHRVLKPGGILIIIETNTTNPLFRFYMGYIFPILKKIDEGTERWIKPEYWRSISNYQLLETKYFTFLPDFVPKFLLKYAIKVESFLENSAISKYSVHYISILMKSHQ